MKTADRSFLPRFHFLYTEHEAEQGAYYWFMKGMEHQLKRTNELTRVASDALRRKEHQP
jgi:hypothetical protein